MWQRAPQNWSTRSFVCDGTGVVREVYQLGHPHSSVG